MSATSPTRDASDRESETAIEGGTGDVWDFRHGEKAS